MNITGYIVDFLKSGNRVEISGIGTLRIKSIAAQYQKETNTFAPAVQIVEFTRETVGDKKIVDYIAGKECVPRDTAQKMWDNFVVALKEKLQSEGEHQLEDLGILKFNPIGEITFVSNPNINLLENTFGLHELTGIKQYDAEPLRVNPFDYSNSAVEQNKVSSDEKINILSEKNISTSEEESSLTKRLREIVQQLDEQEKEAVIIEEIIPLEETIIIEEENPVEENIIEDTIIQENLTKELSAGEQENLSDEIEDTIVINEILKENESEKVAEPEEVIFESSPVIIENEIEEEKIVPEKIIEKEPTEIKEQEPKKKKRRGILWIIILLLLIIAAGAYYYMTSIRGASQNEAEITQIESSADYTAQETINRGDYSLYQLLLKDTKANSMIGENERLYGNGGIFAMNPIDGELLLPYYMVNLEKLKKQEPVQIVQKTPVQKVEKKPARRKIHIPVKSRSDYEFDLVAGIFRVKSNALKHADDIAQYGIDPYIVEVPQNGTTFYYVSLGGCKTYTEVEALKANYRNLQGVDMAIRKW